QTKSVHPLYAESAAELPRQPHVGRYSDLVPAMASRPALARRPAPGRLSEQLVERNNAARNLAETIANAIRSDTDGLNRIRIYTLGLGDLLLASTGSRGEKGASILQRIANDPTS